MTVELDPVAVQDATRRLRRIEGQVGGIIRMIEERRECRDVIQQVSAASKALERVGFKLLASQMKECLLDEEAAAAAGYSPDEIERLFMSLS